MTYHSSRDTQYVVLQNGKSKKTTPYYYDTDADDDDSQTPKIRRRIVRGKPSKEERIRYVTTDELDSHHRRHRTVEPKDHGIKIRSTSKGEPVVLDEDDNVIKIIRNVRTPSPPLAENRRLRFRSREPRTVYYEGLDNHLVTSPRKNYGLRKVKDDFVYTEDEPSKVVRKIILDPRTGNQKTIYQNDKPKKQHRQKYVVRKYANEVPIDSDHEYDSQQPRYVEMIEHQKVAKQQIPSTKYVMIRKKVDSEPAYAYTSSTPTVKNNRHMIYETATKKPTTKYVYASDGKYYK